MSDSESLNTSLVEVLISSKNQWVFIRDLSNHTLKIVLDARWASMNVGSKRPISSTSCRHAPLWWFYLHCGKEENGSPGIICLVCHQVLWHQSHHGTGWMGKHLLAKAHITNVKRINRVRGDWIEWLNGRWNSIGHPEESGSRRFTIGSSLCQIIFDIQVVPYWTEWHPKHSKLAANEFETSEFHQHRWNHYLRLGFVLEHIPWNTISNLDLQ